MCGRKSKICCEHIINLAQIAHRLKHDPFFLLSNFQHVALFVMKTIKFDLSGRQLGLVICRKIKLFFYGNADQTVFLAIFDKRLGRTSF